MRLSDSKTLSNLARPNPPPDSATTTLVNVIESGAEKAPNTSPNLIEVKARIAISRLAAGPAAAMMAARRGYLAAQLGS